LLPGKKHPKLPEVSQIRATFGKFLVPCKDSLS
jgi:hypothetical protein